MHRSSEASHDYIDLSNQLPLKALFLSSVVHSESDENEIIRGTEAFNWKTFAQSVFIPDKALSLLNVRASYLAGVLGEQHLF